MEIDRRLFLAGSMVGVTGLISAPVNAATLIDDIQASNIKRQTFICEFNGWEVYEDRQSRDGALSFIKGNQATILSKRLEKCFDDIKPAYLGLNFEEVCRANEDLLANKILSTGDDPDPETIKNAAPVLGWNYTPEGLYTRMAWTNFVGTRQQSDTMPVFPNGRTRGYRPAHEFNDLYDDKAVKKRWEGLLGGWLPVIHKVINISPNKYYDLMTFADVDAKDKFFVQTWHRTIQYENGKAVKTTYGHSFAPFPPKRQEPKAEDFYRALLRMNNYWHDELKDLNIPELPDKFMSDMVCDAFVKELITRPNGDYPKYGVVDRDYYGSEYDGFQDTFTSSLYANLEWGRFKQAKAVLDNYFTEFVFDDGMINMRGPEVPQFGLTLSLLARYLNYTSDVETLRKFKGKIIGTIDILIELHDLSLKKNKNDIGYGLIDGWSESDACLHKDPKVWWKPFWNNSAFAVRGWIDIAKILPIISGDYKSLAAALNKRAIILQRQIIIAMQKSIDINKNMSPLYIASLPGRSQPFRDALAEANANNQSTEHLWAHRVYAETLQADVLPIELANKMIDSVRNYGGTSIGVLANFSPNNENIRSQLGFISYGYAQQLLRSNRVEEYLLFLYSHIYHSHTPGTWVAGEVSEIDGSLPLYCIPAQLTIPKLVRWMLVFEASDDEILYLGKAIPRRWLISEKNIVIKNAPTRWGAVDFSVIGNNNGTIKGNIKLNGNHHKEEIHLSIRIPKGKNIIKAEVNDISISNISNNIIKFFPKGETEFKFTVSYI